MILLQWTLTNARISAKQNIVLALPKTTWGYPTELSIQTSCVCEKYPTSILWTYPIWTGLSSKTVTVPIWKYGCIVLHPLCKSLCKRPSCAISLELQPRALGIGLVLKASPRQMELCMEHEAPGTWPLHPAQNPKACLGCSYNGHF